jgi:hypothetical protein
MPSSPDLSRSRAAETSSFRSTPESPEQEGTSRKGGDGSQAGIPKHATCFIFAGRLRRDPRIPMRSGVCGARRDSIGAELALARPNNDAPQGQIHLPDFK